MQLFESFEQNCEKIPVQSFAKECERMSMLAKEKEKVLSESPQNEIVRTEFCNCIGKVALPRGYYAPTPVQEHLVGNITRGRLANSLSKAKNCVASFAYGLDKNGRIIKISYYAQGILFGIEYLENEEEQTLGLMKTNSAVCLREERYREGKIEQYSTFFAEHGMLSLITEHYWYKKNRLVQAAYADYRNMAEAADLFGGLGLSSERGKERVSMQIYHLTYDEDFLTAFQYTDFLNGEKRYTGKENRLSLPAHIHNAPARRCWLQAY